jgi:hypothetical protein
MWGRSVFRPVPSGTHMNAILAILSHRFAATVYLIYAIWAVVSIITGIPTIENEAGTSFQLIFSSLVLIIAGPACVGAAFWPVLARLELFFSSGFLGLLVLYMYFVINNVINNGGSWAGSILVLSYMVLPGYRVLIIIVLLLRQAKEEKEAKDVLGL